MLLLVSYAFAQELPWDCPPLTEPSDADVYRDYGIAAFSAAWEQLYAEAYARVDPACAWTEAAISSDTTEFVCADTDYTITVTVRTDAGWDPSMGADYTADDQTVVIDASAGASWTRIELASERDTVGDGSSTLLSASWVGAVSGLEDDGWFLAEQGYVYDDYSGLTLDGYTVETTTCTYSWDRYYDGSYTTYETVRTDDHTVVVTDTIMDEYARRGTYAGVDGLMYGAVLPDTWEADPADVDRDGWAGGVDWMLGGLQDCDDTDPTVYAGATEVANDGIDQDCDGADLVVADADGDGHGDVALGGDDCDDGTGSVHPGARDPGGDGIDQDCDGADDIDADGDGYTADGDDRAADCDDAAPLSFPGSPEISYDGIDNDCDGADLTDVDLDGYDADLVGGPDCDDSDDTIGPHGVEVECDGIDQDCDGVDLCPPPDEEEEDDEEPPPAEEEDDGCGGGAGWLLFAPLLGVRRGRR